MNIKSVSTFLAKELTPEIDREKLQARIGQLLSNKGPRIQELIVRGLHGAATIQQGLESFAIENDNSSPKVQNKASGFILRIPVIGINLVDKPQSNFAIACGVNDPMPKQLAKALAG